MNQLLKVKGFIAYLLVVFLNAFVDLGHKIVIQNTIFKTWDGDLQVILTAVINGLILLPFILLFSPSGFLSDRFPKPSVMRYGALAAVGGTALIGLSYLAGWFWVAFGLTLLLSIQSAIYSPAKYGYIRELLGDERLAQGNALVQATTIISILGGTFAFSALFEHFYQPDFSSTTEVMHAIAPLGLVLVALSFVEWILAGRLPRREAGEPTKTFSFKTYMTGGYLRGNIGAIRGSRAIWLSIVGLAMFWAISQVVLAAFPAYAKEVLAETNTLVIQGLLAVSGIGILIGSVAAGRASRAHIELGLVPLGAIGIALCLMLMPVSESLFSLAALLLLLGVCGGLFIVPLNALIQYTAHSSKLGTVLAGNNWIQNLAMLGFLALTVVFSLVGFSSRGLFYLLAITAIAGAAYTFYCLPHSLVRIFAGVILKRSYRVSVSGLENLPKRGGVLLLGNHISWIDWAIVQIACPRPVRFVMLRSIYETWYLKPFLKFFGAIPISAGNSQGALASVNECLKNGEVVCLFPEGAISRTGHLGMFRNGYEKAVEDVEEGVIVPFYLRGLWGSRLSRSNSEKLRENTQDGFKRNVIVALGQPLPLETKADALKQKVFELSVNGWEDYTASLEPLPLAWLKQAKRHPRAVSLIDTMGDAQFSNARVIAGTTAMARSMKKICREQNVGLLLPSSAAGIMANLAVMLNGQTAVNLNFTAGVESVQAAIRSASIDTVYTSARFMKKLKTRGLDMDAMLAGTKIVYLEDVRAKMTKTRLLGHLIGAYVLPASLLCRLYGRGVKLESPAQILFSSGSEGTPKGVVLTHRNLMGNIKQISDVLNTRNDDAMMACLPLFHSFGLTVNSLLPMVEGIPAVCHPDPTDALNIAKAIYRYKVSILCGTATFLRLYTRNRKVVPEMLEPLRVIVAGAEKLSAEVRDSFELKFKKTIFEGYGATETAPVASVNVPDVMDPNTWKLQAGQKKGSVGLPLPGSCFRIVDPESLETLPTGEDGLILVSGGQVMQGYLNDPEKTDDAIVELDGRRWYRTGDKGHLDTDGFLTIVDRYSRFAKIGGEMISLGAVEAAVAGVVDSEAVEFAATNIKDDKKGEKVVLLVTGAADEVRQKMIDAGVNPLMIPAEVIAVEELPKLGSGKIDYKGLKQRALDALA
ncbi:acyl-[ACP]--phospholipid O-acyltransferase [Marinobacterium mangrovicola]|uniref:Acyl-[acyl-carrier-protein]-phospholipid O-acyltransferase/long-chain-fatty-acid--[acyl-carrier-protein] ligase n=1 Tax=Marinobacterium mangrovicola TaxID=1476959 RepID=A0A4R1GEA5_9GAMM|nr:acyl-[ACP]--phospholipid O-acyltransferase [Marinobacterium mangrovicola]TCK04079.1 acyl-[acyl-carrier-protein]-phospholipid O-acyltransferase/long-chain-fatty-acid--[acyl-carrier-protein] ligase [Marinobacterium mangrovicola]